MIIDIAARIEAQATAAWQAELRDMLRSPGALLEALSLPLERQADLLAGHAAFPIRVTRSFLSRMRPGDPDDPLLLQVLPRTQEALTTPDLTTDPLAERDAVVGPGLLHKYASRILTVATSACAIHCRYCFRRHFPYAEHRAPDLQREALSAFLNDHPEVDEVILSGGDPLMLTDGSLAALIREIAAGPGIRTVRIHTRLPIVLPKRITPSLLQALTPAGSGVRRVMVIHCNHPAEIDDEVVRALKLLAPHVTLLNQSVLLRDINDDVEVLAHLSRKLHQAGVLPYYLHQMDRVSGTGHFIVSDEKALHLHRSLQDRVAGYLVPRLVREMPGEAAKRAVIDPLP